MKVLLVVFILCLSLSFISAFSLFNFGAKPVTKSVNTHLSTTLGQRSVTSQQSPAKNVADSRRQQVIASRVNRVNQTLSHRTLKPQQLTPRPPINVRGQQNQRSNVTLAQRQPSPRRVIGFRGQENQLKNATVIQRQALISSKLNRVNQTSLQRAVSQRQRLGVAQTNQVKTVADSQQQAPVGSNANRTPLQRVLSQRQSSSRYANNANHQADSVRKQSSQVVPQTRFGGIAYQQSGRSLNGRAPNNTNQRVPNPRFQSFMQNRQSGNTAGLPANQRTFAQTPIAKAALADSRPKHPFFARNNIQSQQYRTALAKGNVINTKTGPSYPGLTTKVTANNKVQNEQRVPANSYYQQRWRALHFGPSPHSNIQSRVQRRKRDGESYDMPPRFAYGIIFSRDQPLNDEHDNVY